MSTSTMPEASAKKAEKPHTYGNYINGRQVKAETGETFASYNPAKTDEVIGYQSSTPAREPQRRVGPNHDSRNG